MKKLLTFALCLCAVIGVTGILTAEQPEQAAEEAVTLRLADVLPGTVISQAAPDLREECPRTGIYCLDVWDPVVCDDGVTYSNSCYAYVACATGCYQG